MATTAYPLTHDRDYPRQKEGSVNCAVYVMHFIEHILQGEKLYLPQNDVPYLRLNYVAHILMEGVTHGGDKLENSKNVEAIGDP